MKNGNRFIVFLQICALVPLLLSGCDAVTRHKMLTTVFDGVPSLPPAEEYCADYADKREAARLAGKEGSAEKARAANSEHVPYRDKRCTDCHDKTKESGLVAPRNELCFVCHTDFIKGTNVHGPVAVGFCLACHLPHSASFPKLLKSSKGEICRQCHQEKRLALEMHDKFSSQNMQCTDCHNPHFGNNQFFLK